MIPLEMALGTALRHWKAILGGIVLLALTIALLAAKSDARHWRKKHDAAALQIERMNAQAAKQEADAAKRVAQAAQDYAERSVALEPIIIKSRDTVREYAQTDSGRAVCLPAERVRGIQDDDRALETAAATQSRGGAVPDTAVD